MRCRRSSPRSTAGRRPKKLLDRIRRIRDTPSREGYTAPTIQTNRLPRRHCGARDERDDHTGVCAAVPIPAASRAIGGYRLRVTAPARYGLGGSHRSCDADDPRRRPSAGRPRPIARRQSQRRPAFRPPRRMRAAGVRAVYGGAHRRSRDSRDYAAGLGHRYGRQRLISIIQPDFLAPAPCSSTHGSRETE